LILALHIFAARNIMHLHTKFVWLQNQMKNQQFAAQCFICKQHTGMINTHVFAKRFTFHALLNLIFFANL